MIAPNARMFVRAVMTLLINATCHWRAKSNKTKQSLDFWGALTSGTAWTFMLNSVHMLMILCADVPDFVSAVVGGDDVSYATLSQHSLLFPRAKIFLLRLTIDKVTVVHFLFRARWRDPAGSCDDRFKAAAKALSRRCALHPGLLEDIRAYQISKRDQL
eukprot:6206392-Pyramimonas_sp.AAC.1